MEEARGDIGGHATAATKIGAQAIDDAAGWEANATNDTSALALEDLE